MHLIQRMKIWKELKRLERRAQQEPSPSTFVDLGQVYINLDDATKAMRVAQDGLALFPDSVELLKLRDFANRSRLKTDVAELAVKLQKAPSAKGYRELAGLQLDLGDAAAAHATCDAWSLRFPGDAGPWLVLAQSRLSNFYRDLSAREGEEAVRCLQRVLSVDAANARGHRLFGELAYRIGAIEEAKKHLQAIPADPAEPEVQAMLRQLSVAQALGDDVTALLREAEEHGALPNAPAMPRGGPGREEGMGRIRDALAHIAELAGVRKATYIKGSRALVKGAIRDGKDSFLRVVRVVAKAAHRFARRIDIGNFNKGVIDGPFGHICICSYGEVVAAVQCDQGAATAEILAELQELVAGSLYMAGVES